MQRLKICLFLFSSLTLKVGNKQWRIYGEGAIGAIAPKRTKNVCDCRRRFRGGILSACSAENAALRVLMAREHFTTTGTLTAYAE